MHTLDRSAVQNRATQRQTRQTCTLRLSPTVDLESPINLMCMFLDWKEIRVPGENPAIERQR